MEPLTVPTDLYILQVMASGERETPKNLAAILDQDSAYMSGRLNALKDRGLVKDPGPANRSGMFVISDRGRVVAEHADQYDRGFNKVFMELVDRVVENQPDSTVYPGLVVLTETEYEILEITDTIEGVALQVNVAEMAEDRGFQLSEMESLKLLYQLFVWGLLTRVGGMDVYRLTDIGEAALQIGKEAALADPVEFTCQLPGVGNEQ